jgi:hypothetical protein
MTFQTMVLWLICVLLGSTTYALQFPSHDCCRNSATANSEKLKDCMNLRDDILGNVMPSRRSFVFVSVSLSHSFTSAQRCNAGLLFSSDDRRDLLLCLVNLLRLQYWAESQYQALQSYESRQEEGTAIRQLYLETRLVAKAAITSKIGGGSTARVYTIASLKFRESMNDLMWYIRKSKTSIELATDLLEALASIVEFDGLETTIDPSPRSSLMLTMYNEEKLTFVKRMLRERVIPLSQALFNEFDPDLRNVCKEYVKATYPNEIPRRIDSQSIESIIPS